VKTILVIGATGMLGKPVAKQLLKDGVHVRVLARNPQKAQQILGDGFDIHAGDVADSASLRASLKGVDGIHISLKGGPTEADFERMDYHATRDIAQLAKESHTPRITLLSAYAVHPEKTDTPESRAKYKGEQALKDSGVPYTIFRASWFMESLPLFVQGKTISLIGNQSHPLHWVAAEDYARMVSQSYKSDETLNKELYIFGPEAYTMGDAMKIYAESVGLKVAPISTTMLSVLGTLTFNTNWKSMAVLMKHYERWGEDGSAEEANRLLGTAKITLKEWCEKKRDKLTSSH
jgi:uncharacterized protein YbjT (DUF2867 family)